jgi:hypothetical protein
MVHGIYRFDSRDVCHTCVQTGPVVHQTYYLTDTRVLSPEVKVPYSAQVMNQWIYSPTPLQAFRTLFLIEQRTFLYILSLNP